MLEKLRLFIDMEEELVEPIHHHCFMGKLIHLTHSYSNISFVGIFSCFMARLQILHLQAVKCILRYISGTRDFGILYPTTNDLCISGFIDVDFASNEENAKSTTGLVFRIGAASITWMSKCQSCVALSSSEAEYMGLSVAAREAT